MLVHLLGTGSADRWPNPFCRCPSCDWAREHGAHRGRTSALVDGRLLVDPGPDAGAGGVDLSRVRAVLITHAHPDHLDPAFLLAWAWAGGPELEVAGPPEAIAACRPWVGPRAPIRWREVRALDEWTVGGHDIRALPASHSTTGGPDHDGTSLLYEITSTARLLYATDTGALPHAALAGPYDLVLLDETFGEVTDHGTAHLDLGTFGREVAQLRVMGRMAPGGRIVAVHLSHHNPPDVADRLAGIGAQVVADGTLLSLGEVGRTGRRLLITGGARSGKSSRAEQLARTRTPVVYVATAPERPDDAEWAARVAAHRARRPPDWTVVESAAVAEVVARSPAGSLVLVDCLTLWLADVVDRAEAWDNPSRAATACDRALDDVVSALAGCAADVVLVSNEVGAGIVPSTASGRLFRDLMGRANARVAAACDDVEVVVAGLPSTLKGRAWTMST